MENSLKVMVQALPDAENLLKSLNVLYVKPNLGNGADFSVCKLRKNL